MRPEARCIRALVVFTALCLAAPVAAAKGRGNPPCTGVARKAKARLERGLAACSQKGASIDVGRCSQSQLVRYTARLARRGCSGGSRTEAQRDRLASIVRRPVLLKLRAHGVAAEDLAAADAEAREAHLALRGVLARLARAVDAVRDRRADVTELVSFAATLASTVERVEDAESALAAVETALWSGFTADRSFPWIIDEPLRAAMEQVQVELRRLLGPEWVTEIDALRREPACAGDVIGDRLVAIYGEAVLSGDDDRTAEVAALGRTAAQLACLSIRQASLLDAALSVAYDLVATRLERAGLGRLGGDFARFFAPLEVLVLDTMKHAGDHALAWHWFRRYRAVLLDEVSRLGWPTGDIVWLYDRIDGRLIGFPPCAGDDFGRCVDLPAFLASLADPRAIGLGDCALSGMVAGGLRQAGGKALYACPSADCGATDPSKDGGSAPSDPFGRGSRPAIGSGIIGGKQAGGGASIGALPWTGLTGSDLAIMEELACGGSRGGGGGGSGGEDGGSQGPGGSLGDWGGTEECVEQALAGPRDPYGAYTRCIVEATGGRAGEIGGLTSDLHGVPMGPDCGPSVADGSTTTTPGGGSSSSSSSSTTSASSTTEPSSTSTTEPPSASPPCIPSGLIDAIQKIFDCGFNPLQKVLTGETPRPSPAAAAGAVVNAELELLKPENAKNVYGFVGANLERQIELECTGDGKLSAGECAALSGMKPGDAAEYLRNKGLIKDCVDAEQCDGGCTSLNDQVMERLQDCQRQLTDALLPDRPTKRDQLINPGPEGAAGGLPGDPLMACLLAGAPAGGGINLDCAFVSCADGPATARQSSACCGGASPTIGVGVGRIISERTCEQVQCTSGEAVVADDLGDCGCATTTGGIAAGDPTPAPTPGPPTRPGPVGDLSAIGLP